PAATPLLLVITRRRIVIAGLVIARIIVGARPVIGAVIRPVIAVISVTRPDIDRARPHPDMDARIGGLGLHNEERESECGNQYDMAQSHLCLLIRRKMHPVDAW